MADGASTLTGKERGHELASRIDIVSARTRPRHRHLQSRPTDPAALTGEPNTTPPADATISSLAYQQILAVFTTATAAMRAKDVWVALCVTTTAKDTEGLRTKLKGFVARQILIETEPGLFSLAPTTPSTQDAEQEL